MGGKPKFVLRFVLFVFCFYILLLLANIQETKTGFPYLEPEQFEPRTEKKQYELKLAKTKFSHKNGTCPEGNILTIGFGGQLGNRIWEYMSLFCTYELYKDQCNFDVFVPKDVKEPVETVFEEVSIPSIETLPKHCLKGRETIITGGHEDVPVEKLKGKKMILQLHQFSARFEYIAPYGSQNMKKELRFKSNHVERVQKNLRKLKEKYFHSDEEVMFVGMHYRGTDYIPHMKRYMKDKYKEPPDYRYYNKAMSLFQEKYKNLIFILITIDKNWIKKNKNKFSVNVNLEINPFETDKIQDLVLLSHCNHSIIAYGSYASTAALFAGGTTYVYDIGIPANFPGPILAIGMASLSPNWILLTV